MGCLSFIIAGIVSLWLCSLFLFPAEILNLKLSDVTLGGLLRILLGLGISFVVAIIAAFFGSLGDD